MEDATPNMDVALLGGAGGQVEDEVARSRTALGIYASAIYARNREHRISCGMENELVECLYAGSGRYKPEELARYRMAANADPVYFPYTELKIQAAVAWISEIFLNSSERTYMIKPTPRPDMPQEEVRRLADQYAAEWVQNFGGVPSTEEDAWAFFFYCQARKDELDNAIDSAAREKARNMERLIEDQFVEGGWRKAVEDVIRDMATYGTGVLKGPVWRKRSRVAHVPGPGGETTCELVEKLVPEWTHVDPFDLFPSPGSESIDDGPLVIKTKILPKDLFALRDEPGYDREKILQILERYPNGGLLLPGVSDQERREQRNDGGDTTTSAFLEGFEFWGDCLGRDLMSWGVSVNLDGAPLEAEAYYECNLIVLDGECVYAALMDRRLGRPFFKGTFYPQVGSWWGNSPCRMMRDVQREMNAAKRSLVHNMGMASGPAKVIYNINALENPQDARVTKPWQVYVGKGNAAVGMGGNGRLVDYLVTPSIMRELSEEFEMCIKHADLITGIPAYSHGSNMAAGSSRTASGLAMLMDAAQRGIKQVIFSLDQEVMRPCITYLYRLNLLTSEDPSVKGDCEVSTGGLLAVISRDRNLDMIREFLVLMQDPAKAAVVGEEGLAALMREYARQLMPYLNPDEIVPTKEALEARKRLAQQQAMEQQMAGQGAPQAPQAGGGSAAGGSVRRPQTVDGIAQLNNPGLGADPSRMTEWQPNAQAATLGQ